MHIIRSCDDCWGWYVVRNLATWSTFAPSKCCLFWFHDMTKLAFSAEAVHMILASLWSLIHLDMVQFISDTKCLLVRPPVMQKTTKEINKNLYNHHFGLHVSVRQILIETCPKHLFWTRW